MNKCCALPVQSYHTTSPSALDRNATRAPPAGLMWSLLGPITPRQRGCGWTCRTGGRALRPARWRTLSPMVQMWGRSKRLRWERVWGGCAFRVSVRIVHTHTHTRSEIHPRCLKWLSLPLPAARPWWGHSWELLVGWWAVCCCANQRGQICLCLQVLAGQRSRRWFDLQSIQRAGCGGHFHL